MSKPTGPDAPNNTDQLFAHPMGAVSEFTFDQAVVDVFPDMIQRSVPGYSTVVSISGLLAEHFSQPGTQLYDLGCSLGATSYAMARRASKDCKLIAVDNSLPMIEQLNERLNQAFAAGGAVVDEKRDKKAEAQAATIETVYGDICEQSIENASVVALNYTLQFIDPSQRDALMKTIFEGMCEGGVLVLSEKICFDETAVNELFIDLHHDFKRANGYSDLEISQKRDAIENVLQPESLETHRRRLQEAGFKRVEVWFQCFNFASLVAFS